MLRKGNTLSLDLFSFLFFVRLFSLSTFPVLVDRGRDQENKTNENKEHASSKRKVSRYHQSMHGATVQPSCVPVKRTKTCVKMTLIPQSLQAFVCKSRTDISGRRKWWLGRLC
ncbi:hypothetical protein F5H01DRAFT_354491 [Linnemannia elongata]|nr:hypothetical protein F5H01DRAFT_354491 [Linnemannia elongata]